MKKHLIISISFIIFFLNCSPKNQTKYNKISGKAFGTYYHITYSSPEYLKNKKYTPGLFNREIKNELENLSNIFSTYDKQSILSKWNARRNTYNYKMPDVLIDRIKNAYKIYEISNGLYDVTVNPLYRIWNFYQKNNIQSIPSEKEIKQVLPYVGMNKLIISDNYIKKMHPKIEIDLSSIAKGYAVDYIASIFQERYRINHYMIEIGGEVKTSGLSPSGEKWKIALEKPLEDPTIKNQIHVYRIIEISNVSVASSGNYRNFYFYSGKKYSHIINPKTGYPLEKANLVVTVVHPSCEMADAYATAFFALPVEEGLRIAEKKEIAVNYGLLKDNNEIIEYPSKKFKLYMK